MSRAPYLTPEMWVERRRAKASLNENGCLIWNGHVNDWGYAESSYKRKTVRVHRVIYEITHGPIPEGMVVCHSCDTPACINIDHLWLGSVKDNKHDEMRKGRNFYLKKTHCPRGHSYAEFGVQWAGKSHRHCSICLRARARLRYGWPEDLAYSVGPMTKQECASLMWKTRSPR